MTYSQAAAKLPADAKWSASFGNPGFWGYVEYHRDDAANRYILANGHWDTSSNAWTFEVTSTSRAA